MRRAEIDRNFDEIVAFAEAERFIDTPVKRFSSRMQVRLAFTVAAQASTPKYFLVDEVLSLGDLGFQRKSLRRIERVAEGGKNCPLRKPAAQPSKTPLPVGRLDRARGGSKRLDQPPRWLRYESGSSLIEPEGSRADDQGSMVRFMGWRIGEGGRQQSTSALGPVTVAFRLRLAQDIQTGHHGIAWFDHQGELIWATAVQQINFPAGLSDIVHRLPTIPAAWSVQMAGEALRLQRPGRPWDRTPDLLVSTPPATHPRISGRAFSTSCQRPKCRLLGERNRHPNYPR